MFISRLSGTLSLISVPLFAKFSKCVSKFNITINFINTEAVHD